MKKNRIKFDPSNDKHIRIGIGVCFLLLIFFFIYGVFIFTRDNSYKKIKENPRLSLIYSTDDSTNNQDIPYINISNLNTANERIENFVKNYTNDKDNVISYDYNINGIVLSLIISALYEDDEVPSVSFLSMNINLDEKKIISDKTLIDYYGLTKEDIITKIENNFKEHYNKEIKKGYIIKEECDFECYLGNRGDYKDHNAYYIENGNLYVYVPFDAYSVYGEEEYFKDKDFKIYLEKAPEE